MSVCGRTFVLVHGGWHGGWCWKHVRARLRAMGHEVHIPTLTGLGERAHLLSPEITIETGVEDIAGVFAAEELGNVVLVGHSAGAAAVAGVADRMPERIASIVWLDGLLLNNGESLRTYFIPQQEEAYQAALGAGSVPFPPPPAAAFGIPPGPDADWAERRMTAQPFGTVASPLGLRAPLGNGLPCTYLACVEPQHPFVAASHVLARQQKNWRWREIHTSHDAMITAPGEVATLLHELA